MTTSGATFTMQASAPSEKGAAEKEKPTGPQFRGQQLILGLVFGLAFGFLLQKGGVAKYHILIGSLLLEDLTVFKVMLTAIAVGCIGIFSLYGMGLVQLHVKPTRYAANIVGGLIFGVGFALMGYCPGTGAAALGQGNADAIAGVIGLMLGSYLFAEASGWLDATLMKVGDRGKLMLHEVVGLSLPAFLFLFVPVLIAILVTLAKLPMR